MAYPPITTLPSPPSRQDPANFADEADAFLGALPDFGDEANALASYLDTLGAGVDADVVLAEEWASKTTGIVDTTDYSSKAWAIGGTGVTDTASAGAAKEWAIKAEDSTVDGTSYSALHYAAKSAASAASSADSATAAANSAASAGAVLWVSGTSYDVGYVVYSPIDFQNYRCIQATSGTTDPSLDTTNWTAIGDYNFLRLTGGTLTGTLGVTVVDFGDWTITESGGSLYFATGGVNKMKLDASGNLDVVGNVNTNATIS
jgi:hypothetical protein